MSRRCCSARRIWALIKSGRRSGGPFWTTPSASFAPDMGRRWPNTTSCWTTRPGFFGIGRRIPACWRCWRTSTRPWPGRGPAHSLPGPLCGETGPRAAQIQRDFSGDREELILSYQTVGTVRDPLGPTVSIYEDLRAHQDSHRRAELEAGPACPGPTRTIWPAWIDGQPARPVCLPGPDPDGGPLPEAGGAGAL